MSLQNNKSYCNIHGGFPSNGAPILSVNVSFVITARLFSSNLLKHRAEAGEDFRKAESPTDDVIQVYQDNASYIYALRLDDFRLCESGLF
jgi:hypothetical protein